MGKKPRENRVPIMMSDEELTAIDDWRFANRVATRSDAVRRLVQIGLSADREIIDIIKSNMGVFNHLRAIGVRAKEVRDKAGEGNREEVLDQVIVSMVGDIQRALALQSDAADGLFDLLGEIGPMRNAGKFADLDAALEKARENRADAEQREMMVEQVFGALPRKDKA